MRILVLSNASWDNRNSVGNTLSNWFEGWNDADFFCIYSRDAMPDNSCCQSYFSVSSTNLLKNLFTPWRIGYEFNTNKGKIGNPSKSVETSLVRTTSGWKRDVAVWLIDQLYRSKIWLNSRMKSYIKKANPDIVFLFAMDDSYRYYLVKYIKKYTTAKVVMFIPDDIYGAAKSKGISSANRYRKFLGFADKIYGASQLMCDEYKNTLHIPIEPLYKGCNIEEPRTSFNTPIEIVYAGNLLFNRTSTLAKLASTLKEINSTTSLAHLSIYTGTYVTDSVSKMLNIPGASEICGSRPYDEIKQIMKRADIVLHVESFDPKQIEIVKLSFSTKIIDCLQSGATMMVVGPKGIASVEYPRSIEGTIVIDDLTKIQEILTDVISNKEKLPMRSQLINRYACENHPIEVVRNKIQISFRSLLNT